MTPAGPVVVVDGGKLPGERSKRRRVPESIVLVYYVHAHHVRAQEHCTCVLRAHHVPAQHVRAHHVCLQEQLVASAHHTNTPIVQALHMARAHTYTPINKCRLYTIHPADA